MLLLPSCGFIGTYEDWAAYSLDVKVVDSKGEPLQNAIVRSSHDQEIRADQEGRLQLKYMLGGLHVLTVMAPGMQTQQVKVLIPNEQSELAVTLNPSEGNEDNTADEVFVENQ